MKSKPVIALLLFVVMSTAIFASSSMALRGKFVNSSSSSQSAFSSLSDPSHINGTVTDAVTTSPISDANITAGGVSDLTDQNGHYNLDIAAGNYTVMAAKTGYMNLSKNATVAVNQTTTVNFALSPVPTQNKTIVVVHPRALNLKSNGRWITVSIELPKNVSAKDVDISSIKLSIESNNTVSVDEMAPMEISNSTLIVKFSREAVEALVLKEINQTSRFSMVTFTLSGKLMNGTTFTGDDTIKTIFPMPPSQAKKPAPKS